MCATMRPCGCLSAARSSTGIARTRAPAARRAAGAATAAATAARGSPGARRSGRRKLRRETEKAVEFGCAAPHCEAEVGPSKALEPWQDQSSRRRSSSPSRNSGNWNNWSSGISGNIRFSYGGANDHSGQRQRCALAAEKRSLRVAVGSGYQGFRSGASEPASLARGGCAERVFGRFSYDTESTTRKPSPGPGFACARQCDLADAYPPRGHPPA